jgi:uncharacterized protein YjbI with pentapeptide repeats
MKPTPLSRELQSSVEYLRHQKWLALRGMRPKHGEASSYYTEARWVLRESELEVLNLDGADLRGVSWLWCSGKVTAMGADFRGADLRGSDLRQGNWDGTDFRGADLTGVDMEEGFFVRTDFRDAVMIGVKVGKSYWKGAVL